MKRLMSLMIACSMLVSAASTALPASAVEITSEQSQAIVEQFDSDETRTYGDYEYLINFNGTAEITKYIGNDIEIEIPSEIDGHSVTVIGNNAFAYCSSVTSITIPDSVTVIDYASFYSCTSLISIHIPNNVTYIGDYAFDGCEDLTIYSYENSYAEKYADENNISFVALDYWETDPADLDYKILDDGTISITGYKGDNTEVRIPKEIDGIAVTSIGEKAFYKHIYLTSVTIPDTVTCIGDYAFYDCHSLTSITIPDTVTYIGNYAFYFCTSLTSIIIPDAVTYIGEYAFSHVLL